MIPRLPIRHTLATFLTPSSRGHFVGLGLLPLSDGLQLLLAPSIDDPTITIEKTNTPIGSVLRFRKKASILIDESIARPAGHDRGTALDNPIAFIGHGCTIFSRSPSDRGLSESGRSHAVVM